MQPDRDSARSRSAVIAESMRKHPMLQSRLSSASHPLQHETRVSPLVFFSLNSCQRLHVKPKTEHRREPIKQEAFAASTQLNLQGKNTQEHGS